jgi:hypothetical protein
MTEENVVFVNNVRSGFSGDWQIITWKKDIEISGKFLMKQWTTQKDRQTKSVVCPVYVIPHPNKMESHAVSFIFVIIMCIFNGSCMLKKKLTKRGIFKSASI